MNAKAIPIYDLVQNPLFFIYVAYMSDVYATLNITCKTMQGHEINKYEAYFALKKCIEAINAMIPRNRMDLEKFPNVKQLVESENVSITREVINEFALHLRTIKER